METFHDCTTNTEYHSVYDTFHCNSDLLPAKERWLRENLPRITQALRMARDIRETFSVLSVGCGKGEVDMMILSLLLQDLGSEERIEYVAVDPSASALQEFAKRVTESAQLQKLCLKNHEMTFQEYCAATRDQRNCFDLIHFISSLYYCEVEETLLHCYEEKLKKNGAIFCMVVDVESQYLKLNQLYHGKTRIDDDNFILHTADELVKIVKKHGWKYEKSEYKCCLDVTECFDETSEVGNILLSFILNVKDIRSVAGRESTHSQRINDLLEMCSVQEADSRRMMHCWGGILTIYK